MLIIVLIKVIVNAQSCDFYTPSQVEMVCNAKDWNWQIERDDPNYCITWAGFISGSPNSRRMAAPWHNTNNLRLIAIGEANDYTGNKGWELIKKISVVELTMYFIHILFSIINT